MKEKVLNFGVLNKFKEYLILSEKSENTVEKYLRDVGTFCEFVGGDAICKETVIAYKNKLLTDILGHSSINTTRIYIIYTGTEHRRRIEQMRLII